MLQKHIDQIINQQLQPHEALQPDVYQLLMNMVPRVIEAGTIYKKDGKYRFGGCEVSEPNAIKRVINNLSSVLKSNGGYKIGLVDRTKEKLEQQHDIISSQVRMMLPSEMDDKKQQKLAADIADVILTSWQVLY